MAQETRSFQAEVSRLLDIVAHSLYSQKEIFLRELISNASDACDRLRYQALTHPELIADDPELAVTLTPDKTAKTLTVADNGIGMSHDELIENLGTIARSGTAAFVQGLSGDSKKDMALIGQFGVGFYSAFMVAGQVEVVSRKAGEAEAWRWRSDGKGEFTVDPAEPAGRGTTITLFLNEDEQDFLEDYRIRQVVKTYSDHIALPIRLVVDGKTETVNAASALWTRPKSEITAEQYKEFYHDVSHQFDEPWLTIHAKAEGTLEYTSLLFVPSTKPFDLFDVDRKTKVKLYVRRVYITDDAPGLVPPYLRFLKGVVDSEDLPLNISREMLQSNPMLARMKSQIVKRVIGELAKKAKDEPEEYAKFWEALGAVLKEGLYEDYENRDALVPLVRVRSTAAEGLTSLEDYVSRMKPGQEAIYFITGDKLETLRKSPQLEGFRAKGVEIVLLTDPVDEFWLPALGDYQKHEFRSVTRGAPELDKIEAPDKKTGEAKQDEPKPDLSSLIALFKLTLGDAVRDVRPSERLTTSAVCLVADKEDMDLHMERLLRQHNRVTGDTKRILEINPRHKLIARLATLAGQDGATDALEDFAWLLFDQARLLEGEALPDPAAFALRMSAALEKGLG
ncbi:MAG TPA: molecular chaperone HtpG [Stellaceae bacterium]|nr:molecular chaperone HtpG [Stellaceae bacterium]